MKDFYIFHFIRYVWIIRFNTFAYRIEFCGDARVSNGILFWFPIELISHLFSFTFLKSIRLYYHYLVLSSLWIFNRFHFKALSFCEAFSFLSLTHPQSISPGMVQTDFLSAYSTSFYAGLPRLKADDVTDAVLYALSTSEHTQVHGAPI